MDYSLSQRSYHITLLKSLTARGLESICLDLYRTLAGAESSEARKVHELSLLLSVDLEEVRKSTHRFPNMKHTRRAQSFDLKIPRHDTNGFVTGRARG